jgi:hypothetical protein
MARAARWLAVGAFLGAAPAGALAAAERFDHQGSLFAVIAPGGAFAFSSSSAIVPVVGPRWAGLLGGGLAVGHEEHELLLLARATGRGGAVDATAILGARFWFGDERWRTFFDLQLAVPVWPALLAGPRFGAGVQYELSPVVGAFCAGALQAGLGSALLFTGDVACGVQLRTYVFQ